MYDIRQFKPALYILLLAGMSGFALAAQWPGVWVLAVGGVMLNAWLVKTGRFTPMPRFLASIVTIVAFIYIADLVLHSATTPILIIGQFLVLLQLVKLFEQRANRDYAQLIVLSLLLMVAAAINTASLIFGMLFVAYLFLSLYVCLLFHLKVESEEARKAISLPEIEVNPNTLRQDQRYLSSSMRRLTGLISGAAVVMAVVVFLFFPRNTGANILGPLQFKPSRALTGFNDQVGFQQVARITQNHELVAHVKIWHDGKLVEGTRSLLLRGLTLDYYTGGGSDFRFGRASPYQWIRALPPGNEVSETPERLREPPEGTTLWKQQITLRPTGTSVVFALEGPISIRMNRRTQVRHSPIDEAIQLSEPALQPIDYEVTSSGEMPYTPYARERFSGRGGWGGGAGVAGAPPTTERIYARVSNIDPKIVEYARRPEVSGRGEGNVPLVELRDRFLAAQGVGDLPGNGWRRNFPLSPFDDQIARNIATHLQTAFTYTLDLTDAKRIEGQDPMVAFLYDFKRGHCEYFAGAMTLMLQSLDIPARMVIGFRCDDYNAVGEYYRVEQSQAHAWVESRGGSPEAPVWITYDPTSGREDQRQRVVTMWTRVKHIFDFLEHSWASNVIAYDRGSRDTLVQTLESRLTSTAVSGSQQLSNWPNWLNWLRSENWAISSKLLLILVILSVIALIVAIVWFVAERWRMWRRAERIGLDTLPSDERLRLVRQLAFYDDLLRLLEKRGLSRPRHLTPMEFTDSLAFLPAEAYHAIRRLTEVFYRIRYGKQELTAGKRLRLNRVIENIESTLGPAQLT